MDINRIAKSAAGLSKSEIKKALVQSLEGRELRRVLICKEILSLVLAMPLIEETRTRKF